MSEICQKFTLYTVGSMTDFLEVLSYLVNFNYFCFKPIIDRTCYLKEQVQNIIILKLKIVEILQILSFFIQHHSK